MMNPLYNRTLNDALINAERLRKELPMLIQPEPTSFDMVKLADTVNILMGAIITIADPLSEVPKQIAKSSITLCDFYENLAMQTLKIVKGEYVATDVLTTSEEVPADHPADIPADPPK